MEAQIENPFIPDFKAILANLNFVDGKPRNTEEISNTLTQALYHYLIGIDGDFTLCKNFILNDFAPLESQFTDENAFLDFINLCIAKLKAAKDKREREEVSKAEEESIHDRNSIIDYKVSDAIKEYCGILEKLSNNIELRTIRKLEQEAKNMDPDQPIENKFPLAQKIRSVITALATAGKLDIEKKGKPSPLTSNECSEIGTKSIIYYQFSAGNSREGELRYLVKKMKALEREMAIMEKIGHLNKAEFEKNRLRYGAKGANLLVLKKLLPALNEICGPFSIPPFELVEIDHYKKWLRKEETLQYFKGLYERWQGSPVMIRSSAVYSEDGDNTTGAGKYESIPLEAHATFAGFMAAVEMVYASCNSEEAIAYRRRNGIEEEFMGLVVQKRIDEPNLGYINSSRPGLRGLTNLKFTEQLPLIFNSLLLDEEVFSKADNLYRAYHVQPDFRRQSDADADDIILLSRILSQYYHQPVQIEFSKRSQIGIIFELLQIRPLPSKMFQNDKLEFPENRKYLYECNAEGVCDEVLNILDGHQDNTDATGLVMFTSSLECSLRDARALLERALPCKGAVLIFFPSSNGHIETIAREKGLVVLSPKEASDKITLVTKMAVAGELRNQLVVTNFLGHQKVQVISNGIRARIYNVDTTSNNKPENIPQIQT